MHNETAEGTWVERHEIVSITQLVNLSGLSEADLRELVDYGALVPADRLQWTFSAECVVTLRKASRLKDDLDLDTHALALALRFLEQIRALEAQLAQLRARG